MKVAYFSMEVGLVVGMPTYAERQIEGDRTASDAASMYNALEQVIIPLFYHDRDAFIDVMRHAIALNGSFFNSHRMVEEYVVKAYAV